MIVNTRHTGFVVRDLQQSIDFYSALGLTMIQREKETGIFIEQVTGIEQAVLEWAKLKTGEKGVLELLQYHTHAQNKPFKNAVSNQLGCSHVAFTVLNIANCCEKIINLGGSIVNIPALSPNGKVKVAYCHDIDGILLEIVEEIA